jgi:hypothetical protein
MKAFLLASMLFLLWALSCNKDKDMELSGLTIVGRSACGWCAGSDSVIITEYNINYRLLLPCDHHAYSRVSHMTKTEWDELTGLIDLDAFNSIHLNSCNICVDGCDTWITIRNGSYSHTIRYGYQDSAAIEPIKPLADKLDSIRESFRKQIER